MMRNRQKDRGGGRYFDESMQRATMRDDGSMNTAQHGKEEEPSSHETGQTPMFARQRLTRPVSPASSSSPCSGSSSLFRSQSRSQSRSPSPPTSRPPSPPSPSLSASLSATAASASSSALPPWLWLRQRSACEKRCVFRWMVRTGVASLLCFYLTLGDLNRWNANANSLPQNTRAPPASSSGNISNSTTGTRRKPVIAIAVPTRSVPTWESVHDTSLFNILLPSLERTITAQERQDFQIEVVIGMDDDDAFWNAHASTLLANHTRNNATLPINVLRIQKSKQHRIPNNEICLACYEYGADYITRINDDTEFATRGWVRKGVAALRAMGNVGVVGPTCREGNTAILTHDMVHRTHLEIFDGRYYPEEFDNYYIDGWISRVYEGEHRQRLEDWVVVHHVNIHGTRYKADLELKKHLKAKVTEGRAAIAAHLQQLIADGKEQHATRNSTRAKLPAALGTSKIQWVGDGMKELHERRQRLDSSARR